MVRNLIRRHPTSARFPVAAPPRPTPVGDEASGERGVCRVSFRPSPTVLDGVGCLLSEFFSSQLSPEVAASFARAAEDLLRGWVRPGIDQSARVRLSLWPERLEGTLDAQVSFSAPGDDWPRLLALVEQLGRTSGKFSYRLLPRSTRSAEPLVRAEGDIETQVHPLANDECVVTSTLRIRLSVSSLSASALEAAPRAPGQAR